MFNFRILGSVIIAALAKQTEPKLIVATKIPIHHQPRNLQHWVKPPLPTQSNLPARLWQYFLAVSWWHSTFSRTCKKNHFIVPFRPFVCCWDQKAAQANVDLACAQQKKNFATSAVCATEVGVACLFWQSRAHVQKKNLERLKQTPVVYASKIN